MGGYYLIMGLEIRNLSKNYGAVQALDNVSLTLDNGIYGLLGPNGARYKLKTI